MRKSIGVEDVYGSRCVGVGLDAVGVPVRDEVQPLEGDFGVVEVAQDQTVGGLEVRAEEAEGDGVDDRGGR